MKEDIKLLRLKRLKAIYELKKTMRTYWGALTSFQTQIYSVDGTLGEVRILLEEVTQDIREMSIDLNQIKEALKRK